MAKKVEKTAPEKDAKTAIEIPAGTVYTIEVEGKKAYLRKPDRHTVEAALGYAMPIQGRPQYVRAGEIVLLGCWLGGDEEIKTDDDLLVPAAMQAFQTISKTAATLKKN